MSIIARNTPAVVENGVWWEPERIFLADLATCLVPGKRIYAMAVEKVRPCPAP